MKILVPIEHEVDMMTVLQVVPSRLGQVVVIAGGVSA